MKVKFLQSFISKLGGVAMYKEEYREILFIDNKERYFTIKYEKGCWKDAGYSISGESLGQYEGHLTYIELKTYINNLFEEA